MDGMLSSQHGTKILICDYIEDDQDGDHGKGLFPSTLGANSFQVTLKTSTCIRPLWVIACMQTPRLSSGHLAIALLLPSFLMRRGKTY